MREVVAIAHMVPFGIEAEGSLRSPERFEPAMIPVTEGKKMPMRIAKDVGES